MLLFFCIPGWAAGGDIPGGDGRWFAAPPRVPAVDLYFFWSSRCPHCLEARPFIESLPAAYPWVRLHSLEILDNEDNRRRFIALAQAVGFEPSAVPTFVWCGRHTTGYADAKTTGGFLLEALSSCYRDHYGTQPDQVPETAAQGPQPGGETEDPMATFDLRLPGGLDPERYSLPVMAVVMGALDAFNPCAFFVLLFLLSLLVNGRSRRRMLLVGGLYVAVSGLVYFAFMAAWLNLFQLLEGVKVITLGAGLVAVVIGLLNIKDYFWLRQGVSVGLSDHQRSRLFRRMRGLLTVDQMPTLVLATLALALAANSYELLCTMGLPMVFTRILTLEQLPELHYYGYLALYNLVYVLPLAVIVGVFVWTMGRHKLSDSGGRLLKLLSGCMMAALGLVLLADPNRLSQPLFAVMLIVGSIGFALLIRWVSRAVGRRREA